MLPASNAKFPAFRRKYPASTDTPEKSSCCIDRLVSHSYPRLPQPLSIFGSNVVALVLFFPKFTFDNGPHSPLAAVTLKSQLGTKSPLRSVKVRVAVRTDSAIGLFDCASWIDWPCGYLPTVTLRAVLPSPNRL